MSTKQETINRTIFVGGLRGSYCLKQGVKTITPPKKGTPFDKFNIFSTSSTTIN